MPGETVLSSVLREFARTIERIVEVLPVTSAGVPLVSSDRKPHHVAASDPAALRFCRPSVGRDRASRRPQPAVPCSSRIWGRTPRSPRQPSRPVCVPSRLVRMGHVERVGAVPGST